MTYTAPPITPDWWNETTSTVAPSEAPLEAFALAPYEGPCVSDCWELEGSECKLKPECASIECLATKMVIRCKRNLFGSSEIETVGGKYAENDDSDAKLENGVVLECGYGDKYDEKCGTKCFVENDK